MFANQSHKSILQMNIDYQNASRHNSYYMNDLYKPTIQTPVENQYIRDNHQ